MTWQRRTILTKLREGCTSREAAAAAGIHRQSFWRWVTGCPEFASAVVQAREAGADERRFRAWLRHPFRGKRPPTGRGHAGKPAFSNGRRG
jgi:hypothetical protein